MIAYEMIWNLISLFVVWKLRGRLRPDGMLFAVYLVLYSGGRFFVTFLREDKIWALGLQEAQYISLLVLLITVPLLAIKARAAPVEQVSDAIPSIITKGTRAERRRKHR